MFRPAALLCLALGLAFGQETIHHASITGRITDPSGAVVQGATVTARQAETNITSTAATDRDGRFRFAYLKVGPYEVKVRKEGFAEGARTLTLSLGAAYDLDFQLALSAAAGSSINVSSDSTLLEAARSQIASTVAQTEIRQLPLNGRSFLDLALLAPGVSPTNTGSNQLFPETSAVPGQGISVSSQRNFSNSFVVDGLSANDDAAGLSGSYFGLDTIHELAVVTSGGQAELGRALGGFINVVTKSGTNALHGDLYGYLRNQRFQAANPLSNNKLPLTQMQYGASLGGPLRRDRTFYFGNFEQRLLNQSGLTTITPANVAAINTRLDGINFAGQRIATGIYPNPAHLTTALGKLDHAFGTRDQFSLRYNLYRADSSNSRGAGALNAITASTGLENTDQSVAVGNVLTLSPRTMNETRAQYARGNLSAEPSDPAGPAINIAGVANFGRSSSSPTGRLNDLFEIVNNLSHQAGTHAIRVGANFLYNSTQITYPRSLRGAYTFSSLANFQQGIYNNAGFTQTFGNSVISQTNPNVGFYIQDEWKARPSLTFNAGLRYDLQFLETIRTDRNNVSPRLGLAWTPFASRRTVIRAGAGLFFDRVPLRALANALLSGSNTTALTPASQISVSLTPTQAGAPVFPNILASLPAGVLANFTTMDRDLSNAYSTQRNLEIEQQLGSKASLTLGYQHLRGRHLIVSINQNVPTCVAAGTNNGCRPNPAYSNNSQYRSDADSSYNALQASFQHRASRWGNYRISYSYSKAMNNVGEFFFSSPVNPYNIWQDWGRSDDDQRHRVVVQGAIHSPMGPARNAWGKLSHGFQLSGMLQYYSTLPMNLTTGATTVQGTTGRPLVNGTFIERNAGSGSDFFNVNLRVSRAFTLREGLSLEALAEAFNALNHRNNLTRNGVFGTGAYPTTPSATFGTVTAVNDPRAMQFALRLRF